MCDAKNNKIAIILYWTCDAKIVFEGLVVLLNMPDVDGICSKGHGWYNSGTLYCPWAYFSCTCSDNSVAYHSVQCGASTLVACLTAPYAWPGGQITGCSRYSGPNCFGCNSGYPPCSYCKAGYSGTGSGCGDSKCGLFFFFINPCKLQKAFKV